MVSSKFSTDIAHRNAMRQECRTDLLFLCKVLGYKDVIATVHGPVIAELQHFAGGEDIEIRPGVWEYRTFKQHWELEGSRQNLYLYPRGHLKTTVITIAHAIQWILNYPNIRILISTATGDQAELIMGSIKKHFQFNELFRKLFPEYCPAPEKVAEFGSRTQFTVPNRTDHTLKEATVWACSVGKVIAGFRADVIKSSDLVDEQNVKTPGGISEVISHFGHMEPLLERYNVRPCTKCGSTDIRRPACNKHLAFGASRGWNDVEGTRYDFGDLYGQLIKSSDWRTLVRSAIDSEGAALWPERFPVSELERIRRQPHVGDWIFSAQYLNKCVPQGDGLCDPKDIVFIPNQVIRNILPQLRLHCTIDLSGMDPARRGDFTCITVGGFDGDGRLYIIEMQCGHPGPEDVIKSIFELHRRYPQMIDYKIEKEAHARVLLPFLQREMSKRQSFPCIYALPRDTHTSKQHRIRGLRPWFKQGIIRFSQDIPLHTKQELMDEVSQFPSQSSGVHDDILDTLADMMQNQEGGITSDVIADPPDMKFAMFGQAKPRDRFMGFESGVANWLYGPDTVYDDDKKSKTGIL